MKNIFLALMAFCIVALTASARTVKISTVPSDARISIDGAYQGDGTVMKELKKKDLFYVIKVEREGYLTLESRLYSSYKSDEITYTLKKDLFYEASAANDAVNSFFPVIVSRKLYTVDENGKRDFTKVWQIVRQILLGSFDQIQSSDNTTGFMQTSWSYTRFNDSQQAVRTRATVKLVEGVDDDVTIQVKISSEFAPLISINNESAYREAPRLLKKFEPLIGEFQSRLLGL